MTSILLLAQSEAMHKNCLGHVGISDYNVATSLMSFTRHKRVDQQLFLQTPKFPGHFLS